MLKKFKNFILESHSKEFEEFEDIFIDLIDNRFKLEVNNIYLSDTQQWWNKKHSDHQHTIPGYEIIVFKKLNNFGINYNECSRIMEEIDNCNSHLASIGEFTVHSIKLDGQEYRIVWLLSEKGAPEAEVNTKEGFYDFRLILQREFKKADTSDSFKIEPTVFGFELLPIHEVDMKRAINTIKSFVSHALERKYHIVEGPNWEYKWTIEIDGNKILIKYLERIDVTR